MQVGDKVYHKAGTDPMEIIAVDGDYAVCTWRLYDRPFSATFLLTDLQSNVPQSRSAQRSAAQAAAK